MDEPRQTSLRGLWIAANWGSAILLAAAAFGAGWLVRWGCAPAAGPASAPTSAPAADAGRDHAETVWTCSMHPQIRWSRPGQCPLCGMDLVPAAAGAGGAVFTTSAAAAALMDIATAPVERRSVAATVRMVGKVAFDETRVADITAWIAGRLDRLYVDYTGVPVRKGDHMVELYSPDLVGAQEELIQALQAVRELRGSNVEIIRQTAEQNVAATRQKLRLMGLLAEQVADVERRGRALEHLTINAPSGGIVIHKHAQQGSYVKIGSPIYTVADLSRVWIKLDAYESDLAWLRYGQKVEFTTVSYPGEAFTGTVSFIDPVLNPGTRTVKLRVNAPNADGRLKPEMFVHATVRAKLAAGGRVMDAALAGKWISPMHPEIVKDGPGTCDVCGMPLVPAESLGYVSAAATQAVQPLVIPATAPLITGRRAVVYVAEPGADRPRFQGRQIVLGPRAGDYYVVREGLAAGERVVVRGNFKIDSALQIQAQPSMMSPAPEAEPPASAPAVAPATRSVLAAHLVEQLRAVFEAYLAMQAALAADDAPAAAAAAGRMKRAIGAVDMKLLSGADHAAWMKAADGMAKPLTDAAGAAGIERARLALSLLSEEMAGVARRFGGPGGAALFRIRCPMAFNDRGATWLQADRDVRNPYFGAAMPKCGNVVEVIGAGEPAAGGRRHDP